MVILKLHNNFCTAQIYFYLIWIVIGDSGLSLGIVFPCKTLVSAFILYSIILGSACSMTSACDFDCGTIASVYCKMSFNLFFLEFYSLVAVCVIVSPQASHKFTTNATCSLESKGYAILLDVDVCVLLLL